MSNPGTTLSAPISATLHAILKDTNDRVILATVTGGAPPATANLFARGAIVIRLDGSSGTAVYKNDGTAASPVFTLIDSIAASEIALASGLMLVGNGSGVGAGVAMSGDGTMDNAGAMTIAADAITTTKIDDDAVTTPKIDDGAVTSAKLAAGAGVAALLTAGLGGSKSVTKTDAATDTIVAAHGTKDRACLVLVVVDETYAIGTGTLPTVKIGETDTIEKAMAATVLDTEAAGTVLAFAFTNTATKAIIVTTTAAVGDATGGCSVTVLAIPTT